MASLGGSADGPKPDAAWVANEFVKRYYEVLAKHPKYLNRFYKDESQFTLTIRNHGIPELRQTVSTTKVCACCFSNKACGSCVPLLTSQALACRPYKRRLTALCKGPRSP